MKEIRKEDISQEVFDLYDDYAHNRIDRRLFLDKLSTYAVGGITLASLLSFISPDYHILSLEPNRLLEPALRRLKSRDNRFDYRMVGAGSVPGRVRSLVVMPCSVPSTISVRSRSRFFRRASSSRPTFQSRLATLP